MKECSKCKQELDLDSSFVWCKPCRKDYDRAYYQRKKNVRLSQNALWRQEQAKKMSEYKEACGCAICGENAPECLDFHHKDEESKEFNIADFSGRRNLKGLQDEIKKCILLCSNCHRKVHSGRIRV